MTAFFMAMTAYLYKHQFVGKLRTIQDLWGCTKLNLASFGDTNPHLHFHIVPKYEGGFEFGGSFEITNPQPVRLTEEEYQGMIGELKEKLGI